MWFWAPVLKLEKFYSCIIENEKKEYALEQLYRVPLLTFCVNEHVCDCYIALCPSPNLIKYFPFFPDNDNDLDCQQYDNTRHSQPRNVDTPAQFAIPNNQYPEGTQQFQCVYVFFHYIPVFVLLTHLHLTWQFIDPSLIFFSTRWQCWRPSELCEIKVNSRDTYPFMTNNLDCRGHSIPGTISFFCNRNSWHNPTKRFPCCCYFNGLFALVLALAPASVCLFVCLYPLVRKDIKLTLTH